MATKPIATRLDFPTPAEISAALARVLGWAPEGVVVLDAECAYVTCPQTNMRLQFDYRAPDVIWPVATRFTFPRRCRGGWVAHVDATHSVFADCPAKAVALGVIFARSRDERWTL